MTATLAFRSVQGCALLVHDNREPDDDEFRAYLDFCNQVAESTPASDPVGAVIFTDGHGPTPKQRAMVQNHLIGRAAGAPSAILTLSPLVRGIVTALSWAGRNIQAFKPVEVYQAFDYLQTPSPERRQEAFQLLLEMRAKMAGLHDVHHDASSNILRQRLDKLRANQPRR